MLFFGGVSVLSFCYRDLSAWWENRPDQPDTQYHFVITGSLFYGVTLRYRFLFAFICAKVRSPQRKSRRRLVYGTILSHFPAWSICQNRNIMKPENNKFMNVMPINPCKYSLRAFLNALSQST